MNACEILESAALDGVALTISHSGKLVCAGDKEAVEQWSPILREHKSELLAELHRARRHAQIAAMLGGGKYSVMVEDASTDPVIATVGIRGIATFDMAIPKHSYDGLVLMELIEKHSTETHTAPSQLPGKAAFPRD